MSDATEALINGIRYKRVLYGQEQYLYPSAQCPGCFVKRGQPHDQYCPLEACPHCKSGRYTGCLCTWDDLTIDELAQGEDPDGD